MNAETDAEAIAHEVMLHFPDAEWDQALAAGESGVKRLGRNRPEWTYAVREDWAYVHGVETMMPTGDDLLTAQAIADLLTEEKGKRHTVLRSTPGTFMWHEWAEENERIRANAESEPWGDFH